MVLNRAVLVVAACTWTAACASQRPGFRLADPVQRLDDERLIPVPATARRDNPTLLLASVYEPKTPLVYRLTPRPAADVNALDETVASTFYAPRIGREPLQTAEIERGPGGEPPQPPLVVESTLDPRGRGVAARDRGGRRFALRFDPADRPGAETAFAVLAGRVFWAFGYNVPEHHLVELQRADLEAGAGVSAAEVDSILARAAAPSATGHRACAWRLPEGVALGPFSAVGVRRDDPNDSLPHQDRRALRALRALAAWLDLREVAQEMTLDVYEGEPGQGFVRHYLVPFQGRAAPDGGRNDPYLGLGAMLRNLATLGLVVQPWERIAPAPWPDVGTFESTGFEFAGWRENTGFAPIRDSRPDDDYWAARHIAGFTPEQIRAVAAAARFSTREAEEYVFRTLLERQRKVVAGAFARVTPVEAAGLDPGVLRLRDVGLDYLPRGTARTFEVRLQDRDGRDLEPARRLDAPGAEFAVATGQPRSAGGGYLRVVVTANGPFSGARSAEFHLRPDAGGQYRLVGVAH